MSTNFPTTDLTQWISQAEAARLRGVTRQAISNLVRKQKIRTLEVGGHVLVNRTEILQYEVGSAGRPKSKHEHS